MKDIVQRIDEIIAPFIMGMKSKGGGSSRSKPLPKGARFGKIDDLYMEVIYHKTKKGMEAAEDIIKTKNIDKKTAKLLKKYVKKMGG